MIKQFEQDFYWMQRTRTGYYPWAAEYRGQFHRGRQCERCGWPLHWSRKGLDLSTHILDLAYFPNPVLDIVFKSFVRAEVRLISRFIPQRSHEERLTGHLVSEMDNGLGITRDLMTAKSMERYSVAKEFDFLYYDLSRGGKVEKKTGADLGFVVVVDLPDHPFCVKTVILQAKKLNGSAQLELRQYDTLAQYGGNGAAYLFYDMNMVRRSSPMVLQVQEDGSLGYLADEARKKNQKSFSVDDEKVMDHGTPLSLFLLEDVIYGDSGMARASIEDAVDFFVQASQLSPTNDDGGGFNGPVGIISIGRHIPFSAGPEGGLRIGS